MIRLPTVTMTVCGAEYKVGPVLVIREQARRLAASAVERHGLRRLPKCRLQIVERQLSWWLDGSFLSFQDRWCPAFRALLPAGTTPIPRMPNSTQRRAHG